MFLHMSDTNQSRLPVLSPGLYKALTLHLVPPKHGINNHSLLTLAYHKR